MITLGMVGAAEVNHGITFSAMFNGVIDPKTGKPTQAADPKLAGARVTRIWDPNKKAAQELACTRMIDTVCDDAADAAEGVDGVLIPDDCTQVQYRYAAPFIKKGIPLFVDKPLARSYKVAKSVIDRVRKKKMLFQSGSSLRYANEVADLNARMKKDIGKPVLASTFSPNELIFYGIHGLELMLGVVPGRVKTVQHLGTEKRDLVVLSFADGTLGTLICGEAAMGSFHLVVHGTKGRAQIDGITDFYQNMLASFVRMIQTGKPPLSLDDTLHVIAILDAAQKSVESGGQVMRVPGATRRSSQ